MSDERLSSSTTPTGNTYDKYGSTNPIEQKLMAGFMGSLESMLDGLAPARILEIGVGEGHVMTRVRDRFPLATLVGLDLPDPGLAGHWRNLELACMFGDATRLPFADDTFDLVMAIEVLEHVPGPEAALVELARVCRPAGTMIASVPFEPIWRAGNMARRRYVRSWGNTPGHVNHWTRWGFARFVGRRFVVDEVASPLPWTMVRATGPSKR